MGTTWEEVVIQANDRAADVTLVLQLPKQDANEPPPQFTLGDKRCFENKGRNLKDLNEP